MFYQAPAILDLVEVLPHSGAEQNAVLTAINRVVGDHLHFRGQLSAPNLIEIQNNIVKGGLYI